MPSQASHLDAAIADLRRRRASIDTAIMSMVKVRTDVYGARALDTTVENSHVSVEEAASPEPPAGEGEGRAERVRRAIDEGPDGRVWSARELAIAIGEKPSSAAMNAVSSTLSRAARAGVVEKVGRGRFRSTNTSAADPYGSAAEAKVPTLGEGGDPHAQNDPDHHPSDFEWSDDRDRGGDPANMSG